MDFDLVMKNFDKVHEVTLGDFTHMFKQAFDKIKSLQLTGVEAFKECTRYYKQAREWKKAIESYRKQKVEPLRTELARINDQVKEFIQPLEDIESVAKVKIDAFNKQQIEDKRVEDEKAAQACALLQVEAPLVVPRETTLRGDGAIVYEKTVSKFEVTDLRQVPLKYLKVDERLVEQDLKLGLAEIPGLRIWEEKITQIRSR